MFSFLLWAGAAAALPVHRCMNLSNALDAPREGLWGYTILHEDIDAIAEAGFDTVRLPVKFSRYFDATQGKVDPALFARLDEIITWSFDANLKVVLDIHHFDRLMDHAGEYKQHLIQIWAEIGSHYKGWPEDLIFELLNEPRDKITTEIADRLYAEIISTLRVDHPDRWIITEGGYYANRGAVGKLIAHDARTAHSFHYYEPFLYTHQKARWIKPLPPLRGPVRKAEFDKVTREFAELNGHPTPLFLGEFGATKVASTKSRADWLRHVRIQAELAGMSWCMWGMSGDFEIFDHKTRMWNTELLEALIPQGQAKN